MVIKERFAHKNDNTTTKTTFFFPIIIIIQRERNPVNAVACRVSAVLLAAVLKILKSVGTKRKESKQSETVLIWSHTSEGKGTKQIHLRD